MTLPRPIAVELLPHDPRWSAMAEQAGATLSAALAPIIVTVHHIGSTAIQGISAKPILDLIPVVQSLPELDAHRRDIETLGYEWWGELGLPGRRYCTKDDRHTGRRLVQLHCYEIGSSEISRHLAFRDYLRERPDLAREYEREKARCRSLHPADSHAYNDCKNAWIKSVEAEALTRHRR
ncbi:GrpB family protein [Hyphomicrobium sp.]|uniref:GrpB family protein n=1 Tax=Hyphomicrobium sp. TaxID=82 RepID=UPI003F7277D2